MDKPTKSLFPILYPPLFALAIRSDMQDPKKEIEAIVRTLYTTRDADELEQTVTKYFTPTATLSHPMCKANSQNEILGFYQWCRLASPETEVIGVSNIRYDGESKVLTFEVEEKLKVTSIPLPSKRGSMLVRLKLRKNKGQHHIKSEEDFIHPMDHVGLLASPLQPLATMYLRLGCLLSNLGACVLRTLHLNSGLQGGTISYAGVMEAMGFAQTRGDEVDRNAAE